MEGESKPIGTTPNHPIWSVDREAFVRADSLTVGERLQSLNGITTVTNITARGPPEPVYNLEVQVKHTYYVADTGVLVHNGKGCGVDGAINDRPKQIHHFATNKSKTYTPRLKKIADRYGLGLDGKWNKQLLPHQGRHPNKYHDFVVDGMERASREAGSDRDKFLKLFESYVKDPVLINPDLLRKIGWQ